MVMRLLNQEPVLSLGAYSAGMAAGGLLTFDMNSVGARTTLLKRAEILDDNATPNNANLELHLFTDPAMAVADMATFAVTKANFKNGAYLGFINFVTYVASRAGTNSQAKVSIADDINRLIPVHNKVYGQLVTVGTPTFAAASQLEVRLWLAEYA